MCRVLLSCGFVLGLALPVVLSCDEERFNDGPVALEGPSIQIRDFDVAVRLLRPGESTVLQVVDPVGQAGLEAPHYQIEVEPPGILETAGGTVTAQRPGHGRLGLVDPNGRRTFARPFAVSHEIFVTDDDEPVCAERTLHPLVFESCRELLPASLRYARWGRQGTSPDGRWGILSVFIAGGPVYVVDFTSRETIRESFATSFENAPCEGGMAPDGSFYWMRACVNGAGGSELRVIEGPPSRAETTIPLPPGYQVMAVSRDRRHAVARVVSVDELRELDLESGATVSLGLQGFEVVAYLSDDRLVALDADAEPGMSRARVRLTDGSWIEEAPVVPPHPSGDTWNWVFAMDNEVVLAGGAFDGGAVLHVPRAAGESFRACVTAEWRPYFPTGGGLMVARRWNRDSFALLTSRCRLVEEE